MSYRFTFRVWAILWLGTGYGWAGGHFIPGDASVWAYVFQFTILLILLVLGAGFLQATLEGTKSSSRLRRNIVGLNIFAVLTLLINIANIVRGAANIGPYGSHNTLADLAPVVLILIGDSLWLSTNFWNPTKPSLTPETTSPPTAPTNSGSKDTRA